MKLTGIWTLSLDIICPVESQVLQDQRSVMISQTWSPADFRCFDVRRVPTDVWNRFWLNVSRRRVSMVALLPRICRRQQRRARSISGSPVSAHITCGMAARRVNRLSGDCTVVAQSIMQWLHGTGVRIGRGLFVSDSRCFPQRLWTMVQHGRSDLSTILLTDSQLRL